MLHFNDTPTTIGVRDRMAVGLLVLRLVLAIYLVQWGILHFVYTGAAVDVYTRWYGLTPGETLIDGIGLALIIASIMMAAGFGCRIGYGVGLLFQSLMVLGLLPHLLDPYGFHQPPNWINHGLIAQVPALAGYYALFQLRRWDRYSLDRVIDEKRSLDMASWTRPEPGNSKTAQALLIIRLAGALFFFQWGVEKFISIDMSVGMMERWYGVTVFQEPTTQAIGVFEIILAGALATGTLRRLTYGVATLVKLKTCWAIAALLLFPFATESGGRLSTVAASLPTLGALWFLYWTRAWDTLSVDSKKTTNAASVTG